jgi:hypothetical protein
LKTEDIHVQGLLPVVRTVVSGSIFNTMSSRTVLVKEVVEVPQKVNTSRSVSLVSYPLRLVRRYFLWSHLCQPVTCEFQYTWPDRTLQMTLNLYLQCLMVVIWLVSSFLCQMDKTAIVIQGVRSLNLADGGTACVNRVICNCGLKPQ